jgi:hypothetical protein
MATCVLCGNRIEPGQDFVSHHAHTGCDQEWQAAQQDQEEAAMLDQQAASDEEDDDEMMPAYDEELAADLMARMQAADAVADVKPEGGQDYSDWVRQHAVWAPRAGG